MIKYIIPFLLCCIINKQAYALKDTFNIFFKVKNIKFRVNLLLQKNKANKYLLLSLSLGSGGNSTYKTNYADFADR